MATEKQIKNALVTLVGARLRSAPENDDLPKVAKSWLIGLDDVPGLHLDQAVSDWVKDSDFFPTIKQVRAAVRQVEIHNGASAIPNHWSAIPEVKWMPAGVPQIKIPAEIAAMVEQIESEDRLLTDDEMATIDKYMRPIVARMA